jgi:8-oxo-dGTP pyrophosphatase MutT (NUDIX family)
MSKADTHPYHSVNIDLTEQALAREVAEESGIDIHIRQPKRIKNPLPKEGHEFVGVYCETKEDTILFERAFRQRRWEDSKDSE